MKTAILLMSVLSSILGLSAMGNSGDDSKRREVVVLYSGGLDSSALAGMYGAKGYNVVHLLTFCNGAHFNLEYAKIKVREFEKEFPNTEFRHSMIPIAYPFKKFSLCSLERDIEDYHTNLVCVGCKMAMHARAVLYALENNVSLVVDGFVARQSHFPEQDPSFIDEIHKLYAQYNITYENPLYYIVKTKDDVKDILFRYNLSTKSIEGECLFGDTFSTASSENIRRYVQAKAPLMNEYVDGWLTEKQKD